MRSHVIAVSWLFLSLTLFSLTTAFDPAHAQVHESGDSNHWVSRFLYNLLGYSVILLPAAVIVICVKRKSCPLQMFVFGEKEQRRVDVEEADAGDSEDEESPGRQSVPAFDAKRVRLLTGCFVGLQTSYLLWGLLQEKIMTSNYTVNQSAAAAPDHSQSQVTSLPLQPTASAGTVFQFHDSQFLVLVNRILAFVVAVVALFAQSRISGNRRISYKKLSLPASVKRYRIAPLHLFALCSVSNILSSWCQYEALKYVNFPTQVLSKACKLLPVMMMSSIILGKKYRKREYAIVIVISCGMCLFLTGNESTTGSTHKLDTSFDSIRDQTHRHEEDVTTAVAPRFSLIDGLLILALYLTFDSFTSNWQEKLNRTYRVSPLQMMLFVNLFSVLLTLTSLAQQSHLIPSLLTVLSCAELTRDCVLMSLASAVGQLMIFFTISEFGALAFTLIMTLRQVFAIILSCLMYGHPLNETAVVGVFITFAGLFAQIYFKSKQV